MRPTRQLTWSAHIPQLTKRSILPGGKRWPKLLATGRASCPEESHALRGAICRLVALI